MLWATGLLGGRWVRPVLALFFGVFALFFLVKSVQFGGPGCLGAPVCAFQIVFLVFGIAFGIAALVLTLLWLVRRRETGPREPPR